MSSDDIVISVKNLNKCYQIYETPRDRLKQFVLTRMQRFFGKPPQQYYREFQALKDVSFKIKKGETVGIVGRNGSGKSTLLQIICGTLAPTSGNVKTRGRVAALLELGSGFNPEFTGRENVYMNAAVLGLSQEEICKRFDDIAVFADIGDFIEQPVKTYSSGMMVRLAFAVAINVDPEILIVDEALSVGDELFQRKCFSRIETIRASGATILFVSHSGAQVIELCDRAILMDSGQKLAVGAPKQIVGRYQKLLYAPADKSNDVREQILKDSELSTLQLSETDEFSVHMSSSTVLAKLTSSEFSDSFDPSLKPLSKVSYESNGARIFAPKILTAAGEHVNNLTRGSFYRYCYQVTFDRPARNVYFGMMIKTTSGLELGGAVSSTSKLKSLSEVFSESSYKVEFEFLCCLTPGTYFLNAGVVANVNGIETYLHRITDITCFRVKPETQITATGFIDFSCAATIQLDS